MSADPSRVQLPAFLNLAQVTGQRTAKRTFEELKTYSDIIAEELEKLRLEAHTHTSCLDEINCALWVAFFGMITGCMAGSLGARDAHFVLISVMEHMKADLHADN